MIYDAAIDELTQTLDLESKQKADEAVYANDLAEVHAQTIDEVFAILDEEESLNITNWLGTLGTTGAAATSVLSTENSARSGRNSANTTTLNNLKTTLAATRAEQEAAADRLYRNTEQSAWNGYLTSVQSANTVYLGSIKTAENTYKTASDAAESTFDTTTITALSSFQEAAKTLDSLYSTAVADANNTAFNANTFFQRENFQARTLNESKKQTENSVELEDPTDSWWYYIHVYWIFMRRDLKAMANGMRNMMAESAHEASEQAIRTGNPTIARIITFESSVNCQIGNITAGIIDLPSTVEAAFNDIDQSVEVGKEHGLRVGVARQIGLLQFAEASYGVDVMTLQPVDPWSKSAEGSGRFGATSGAIGGVIRGVPSVLNGFKRVKPPKAFAEMMTPEEAARYQAYWDSVPTLVDQMSPAEAARYLARKAPQNVTPGIQRMDWYRVSERTGREESSRVIYDEFGRQVFRVDFTDHMRPIEHTSPHLHQYFSHPAPMNPAITSEKFNVQVRIVDPNN